MPRFTVAVVQQTEREIEVPLICPGCGADFTLPYPLKSYSSVTLMQQTRFTADGRLDDHSGEDIDAEIGPTEELRCAACDFGLTDP